MKKLFCKKCKQKRPIVYNADNQICCIYCLTVIENEALQKPRIIPNKNQNNILDLLHQKYVDSN